MPVRRSPRPRLRVLIVEDNLDMADVLAEVLAADGHQVAIATEVPTALALARQMRPQVLFCDLNLRGDRDGLDLARDLRTQAGRGGMILVAMTGMELRLCEAEARAAGFDRVVHKPRLLNHLDAIFREAAGPTGPAAADVAE